MSALNKQLNYFVLFIFAIFIVGLSFKFQGSVGFNLWDEGFLWYGVQRVMQGEIPIRDFMSYDPGRYYWSAALMTLMGDSGIIALRLSLAVFQALGLFIGLLLIKRSNNKLNLIYIVLSAITLIIWMYPRHKLIDISISLFLIGALTFLIEKPTRKRFFLTGISVGLIAVFGRNHGVYGVVGSLSVLIWLQVSKVKYGSFFSMFSYWSVGVIVGFMPLLAMLLLAPQFFQTFLDSILYLFKVGAHSIPIPVPWPWTVDYLTMPIGWALRHLLIGFFFIGVLLFGIVTLFWIIKKQRDGKAVNSTLLACVFLSFPYAQYAFSRAEVGHLAHGIFPFLIGCFILINVIKSSSIKWLLALMLCLSSVWVMYVFHPGSDCYLYRQCEIIEVSFNQLEVLPEVKSETDFISNLVKKYAPNGESFLVVPFWPGAYPLMNAKSPTWEIYSLTQRSDKFQEDEIQRIVKAKPKFVIMTDIALDGIKERSYQFTHPLIYNFIINHYYQVANISQSGYKLYLPKVEPH